MFLVCTDTSLGVSLFVLVWSVAIFGAYYKIRNLGKHEAVSLISYLIMGWAGFVPILYDATMIPDGAGEWLFAGGLCYTLGTYFYYTDYKPWFHSIWHITVMLGGLCHFVAVYVFILS